jgi:butyrate kinase
MGERVLVINPGSTSTKIAIFDGEQELLNETIRHNAEELAKFDQITDQYDFRTSIISSSLEERGIDPAGLDAVIGRGGLVKAIPGGVWHVNDRMLRDLEVGVNGQHASNLGGLIAHQIARESGSPSLIADPVVVDELQDLARLSGHPELPRKSIFHALNQKAVSRRAAAELGKSYESSRFIVAHMGGGISVGAHLNGRVVDVNNALNGDGPFSPERSGGLPAGQLAQLCFSGQYEQKEIMKMIKGRGGFMAYLGTADGKEVAERAEKGDREADLTFRALAYQVAKEIGSLAPVLYGKVDGVILTGGLAYNEDLVTLIKDRVHYIGTVFVYPGEGEIEALRDAALRVLRGEETPGEYE